MPRNCSGSIQGGIVDQTLDILVLRISNIYGLQLGCLNFLGWFGLTPSLPYGHAVVLIGNTDRMCLAGWLVKLDFVFGDRMQLASCLNLTAIIVGEHDTPVRWVLGRCASRQYHNRNLQLAQKKGHRAQHISLVSCFEYPTS